jgi:uncharacterized repeat protein (TIGR01451 family)
MQIRKVNVILLLAALLCLGRAALPAAAGGTLQLYLPFDETVGATTFADASGNASGNDRDGACSGDSCPTAGVSGKVGTALYFDGTNDYVEVPYNAAFNPNGSFTVAAWVKLDGGSSYRTVLASRGGSPTRGYNLYVTDADVWQFWLNNGNSDWHMVGTEPVDYDTWTHVAGLYDNDTQEIRVYVNGQPAGSKSGVTFAPNTQYPLRVGAGTTEQSPAFFFPGSIDEVRVYSEALTQSQIQALLTAGVHAFDDAYTVRDPQLSVAAPGVLDNDILVGSGTLTATVETAPTSGNLTLTPDGAFVYTPTSGYTGTVTFTYLAGARTLTDTATVTLTVDPNLAPVAEDDTYTVISNNPLTVAAPGLLGNDHDANSDPLTATLLTPPNHGLAVVQSDGSFSYTPALNYLGPDSFRYVASDGTLTDTATVTLNVRPLPCQVESNGDNVSDYAGSDASVLQTAIDNAEPGDLIKVAGTCAGTQSLYGDTQTLYISQGLTLQGGYTFTDWLVEPDPVAHPTTLDAQGTGRVLYIPPGVSVTLDSLIVTGGSIQFKNGAGIYNQGTLTLTNSSIDNNVITLHGNGGGMYNDGTSPTLINVTFSNNRVAYGGRGGGMYNNGDGGTSSPTLTDVTFTANSAPDGGGMYNSGSEGTSSPTLTDVTFTANSASFGGGMYNRGEAGGTSSPTLTDVVFTANSADYVPGLYISAIWGTSAPTLTRVTFRNNTATQRHGAIGFAGVGDIGATITDSVFDSNGKYHVVYRDENAPGAQPHFVNCTFYGATEKAIHILSYRDTRPRIEFTNAIFWGNNGQVVDNYMAVTVRSSIVEDSLLAPERGNVYVNPRFVDAANGDLRLRGDSPAIDAADATFCTATDLRDRLRDDWRCDLGAYETQLEDTATITRTISGPGTYTFGPTRARVVVKETGGCLTGLRVQQVEGNHPQATPALQTGAYWTLTPQGCASGFDVDLTLPFANPHATDRLCRYTGSNWACAASGFATDVFRPGLGTVTRKDVSTFSDWTVESTAKEVGLYLPFDEESGATTFADHSGNGYDGACTGSSCPTAGTAGNVVRAVDFDGTDDQVTVPYQALDNLPRGTIATWLYLDANDAETLLARQKDGAFTYGLLTVGYSPDLTGDPGRLYFRAEESGPTVQSSVTLATGQWYHVAVTFDTMGARFYVDGAFAGSDSGNYALPSDLTGGSLTTVGAWLGEGGGRYLDGKLDDLRIYAGVLSPDEIQALSTPGFHIIDDAYTTREDTPLSVPAPGVLGNDYVVGGSASLTATLVTLPAHGTLTFGADGAFVYTPTLDFGGLVTFTYAAHAEGLHDTACVTLTVEPDAAPVALDDIYETYQNTPLTVAAPGVLDNDSDANGDTLIATLHTSPTHGTVDLSPDGSLVYTPTSGFTGSDAFRYVVSDGVLTATARVTLNVVLPPCQVETTGDNVTDYASVDSSALQTAVLNAAPDDLIRVAGTCAGVLEHAGRSQTVHISQSLTLQGGYTSTNWLAGSHPETHTTRLDAQVQDSVVYVSHNVTVTLDGLLLTRGYATYGGGIYNDGTLRVSSSTLRDNIGKMGGAIHNAVTGTLTLENVVIRENLAQIVGGGIQSEGGAIAITGSTFEENRAHYDGGSIYAEGTHLTVTHSTFEENRALYGGGSIYAEGTHLTVTHSTFYRNIAEGQSGGGIYLRNGDLLLDHVVMDQNEALKGGGGLNSTDVAAYITQSTFRHNTSAMGGGIYHHGAITVSHTSFYTNSAASYGGGIFTPESELVLEEVLLSGNVVSATDGLGGGVYSSFGALRVTSSTFHLNHSAGYGGGLASTESNSAITGTHFYSNTAGNDGNMFTGQGGGLWNSEGTLQIADSTFRQNHAANDGGGLYIGYGDAAITGTLFYTNTAGKGGGGVYNYMASPTLNNVTFSGNSAARGGGMTNDASSSYEVFAPVLTNVTFSANSASWGAGMYNDGSYEGFCRPWLANVTFRNNEASFSGGAIYFDGTEGDINATIVNSLFETNGDEHIAYDAGKPNTQPRFVNCTFYGAREKAVQIFSGGQTPIDFTNVIFWGNNGDITNNDAALNIRYSIVEESNHTSGTGNVYADPRFTDAANSDLHLTADSPAIDAGDNSAVTVVTDMDGRPRIVNGAVDMGAYEFPGTLYLTKEVTPTTDVPHHGTVTYTLTLNNTQEDAETGIVLTDTLPAGVIFGGWVISPTGTVRTDNAIAWNGALSSTAQLTFIFTATHTGDYGDTITNTAHFSNTLQQGGATATFTVVSSTPDYYVYLPLICRSRD